MSPTRSVREALRSAAEIERLSCERSFWRFVQRSWHVVEPAKTFKPGPVQWLICRNLQEIVEDFEAGKPARNLVINVPPGFSKSMLVNVLWPAWIWARGNRSARFISCSYAKDLATRDLVKCRDLIRSDWFQALWPMTLKEDQDGKTAYANNDTGWRVASSVGASLTGFRADFFITDDPHSVQSAESLAKLDESEYWWSNTVPSRVNDPLRSVMVLIMQRLNVRDLSAAAFALGWRSLILPMRFEKDRADPQDWRTVEGELAWEHDVHLQMSRDLAQPVIDEQSVGMYPLPAVEKLERALQLKGGSYAVAGQLQQRPVPRGGGMFPRKYAKFIDQVPDLPIRWVRGWDLAGTEGAGCATAGVKVGLVSDGRVIIGDVRRLFEEAYGVETAIVGCARQDGYRCAVSLPQDPGQAGKGQAAHLVGKLHGYDVHSSLESGSKAERAIPISAQWESGNVYILRAPWNDQFLAEAELFTPTTTKGTDQIDGLSRGYSHLVIFPEESTPSAPGYTLSD